VTAIFFLIYLVLWSTLYYLIRKQSFDVAAFIISYCLAPLIVFYILYRLLIFVYGSIDGFLNSIKGVFDYIKSNIVIRYNRYKAFREFKAMFE